MEGDVLGDLLRHVPFPVLLTRPDGLVVDHNDVLVLALELDHDPRGEWASTLFEEPAVVQDLISLAERGDFVGDGADAVVAGPGDTYLEVSAVPTVVGEERFVLVMLWNATERRRREEERTEFYAHIDLLGRLSETLVAARDVAELMFLLGSELSATFCDWVSFQLYDERGNTARVLIRHRDPHLSDDVELAMRRLPGSVSEQSPSRQIARGHGATFLPVVTEQHKELVTPDPEVRALVDRLGVESVIVVPLSGASGVLGSMAVFRGRTGPSFTEMELSLASEVGRRVGLALESLQVGRMQRELAEELQRGLLTDPPELEWADVCALYRPAGEVAQVGGDWYDAFVREDGRLLVSIGDVVGHDFRAAAAMAQLRGLLRGISYSHREGPAALMGSLDAAVQALHPGTTATSVVAVLDRPAGGSAAVTWTSAGHPSPVIIRADGSVHLLDPGLTDLLLGVLPGTDRADHAAVLGPLDTLLLYSDGLVERRDRDIDVGLSQLLDHARELAGRPLRELCDDLVDRMVGTSLEDDVCVIALRVHPTG